MVTFRAAVASCPRKSGNHNSDNFYFNSKFITEDLTGSQVMLAHKKSQDGIQMYAVTDGSSANAYKDEISLMLVRGLKKFHARLIDDPDLDPVKVIDEYNRDAYAAAKRRSLANESRPNSSLALMYINGRSLVFSNTGNVRIYRIRNGAAELFSVDHTQAQKMVELGLMTADKAMIHPQRKKLTQFFGVMPEELSFKPVVFEETAKIGDLYVICSCGCYENISMARMAEISEEVDSVSDFTKAVFSEAASMGCRDDITVLAVKVEDPAAVAPVVSGSSINASAHVDASAGAGAAVAAGVGAAAVGVGVSAAKNGAAVKSGTAAKSGAAAKDVATSGKAAKSSKPVSNAERKATTAKSKQSGTVLGSLKALLGISPSEDGEENTQIWPALLVFVICLILVIVLTVYGIKIYNKNKKEPEPVKNNYNPYGTVAPTESIAPDSGDPSGSEDPSGDNTDVINPTGSTQTSAPTTTGGTTTTAPTTEAPATTAPSTEAPATDAPATDAPATDAPATDAPATEAPATDAPATDAPATDAPATDAPATDAPATGAPATDAPATDAPATDAPATDAPATDAPATDAPATDVQGVE